MIADFRNALTSDVAVHAAYPDHNAGRLAGAPPDEDTFTSAAHVVKDHIYQQMYVPAPRL